MWQIVATTIFILFGIERFGRRWSLCVGLGLMGLFLWIIGAIFNTNRESSSGRKLHTCIMNISLLANVAPDPKAASPSGASIGMATCIYLFVIPYCFSVGPVPCKSYTKLAGCVIRTDLVIRGLLCRDLQQSNSSLRSHDRQCLSMALELDPHSIHS